MYCPNCGTALPENARACSTCGVQFAPPLVGPPPAQPAAVRPPEQAPVQPLVAPAEQPPATQPLQVAPQQPYVAPTQPLYPPQSPAQPYSTQPLPAQPAYAQQSAAPYQPQPGALIPKKKRTGLIIAVAVGAVVVVGAAVAAFFLLRPPTAPAPTAGIGATTSAPTPTLGVLPAYAPVPVNTSFEDTGTAGSGGIDTTDNTAAESAVVKFYETVNSGDFAAVKALVTADTKSAIDPGAFEGWSTTTFEITWSSVDVDTAYVYGRESVRQFGSTDLGVKFTLLRQGGAWLIKTWTAADEATVNGAKPSSGQGSGATSLSDASARDVVSSLLKARQAGDSQTVRMLTTQKFQTDNGDIWLDGIDNTEFFTKFTIKNAKKVGATYVVTVTEVWNSGTETGTYTVINENGAILVNAWGSK